MSKGPGSAPILAGGGNHRGGSPTVQSATVTSAEVMAWDQLGFAERDQYEVLRQSSDDFRSPFFSLGFLDAIHASRGDLKVILMRNHQDVLGFLPMHRLGRIAVPAGRFFNDAHNIVTDPKTQFDWMRVLGQCQLRSFDFHALVGEQQKLPADSVIGTTQSFSAELADDSQGFLRRLENEHRTIRRQEQKTRKLEREVGAVTLEIDCRDEALLQQAIRWKRDQYRRTNILDLFTPEWTRNLMHCLHQRSACAMADSPNRGLLSVLRAGGQPVAMHFGMIESGLLHYWIPTYDPAFAPYSPGTALFKAIVQTSTDVGIHCLDMGYGEQPYKRKQTDTITSVAHGCVSSSRGYRVWRRAANAATHLVKRIPMKETVKQIVRRIQPNAGISKLR